MARLSEELSVPAENLLTPDTVRRVMWEPAGADQDALADQLRGLGAREWQVELTAPMLADAVVAAQSSAQAPATSSTESSAESSAQSPD
jgi:ribonuclease D